MTTDIHAHYVSPELVKLVSDGTFAPELQLKKNANTSSFSFPTYLTRPFFEKMTDVEKRIEHMHQLSIDKEVLSTWVDIYGYDLPRDVSKKYHSAINETLAAAVKQHPQRFAFVATVPLPWGEDSVAVLQDSVERLGAIGSMIGTNINGSNLDDPRFEPFWKASEELSAPVILHPLNVAGKERLRSYYLANLIGNPFDTTIAATSLVFGGVLDRHPKLKVVLLHGGGYFPHGIGRIDHGFDVRPEAKTITQKPSGYLQRFSYDTIVYDERILDSLVRLVGRELIVLGTDYPFDMEPKNVMGMTRSIFGENAGSILETNARKIFTRL
ncbi:MAG: amidohydrolase family protein [Nitrososphaerales archaeon]